MGEVDPLDAFMAGIEKELAEPTAATEKRPRRDDFEDEDPTESFLSFRAAKKRQQQQHSGDEEEEEYDDGEEEEEEEGETAERKKEVPLLPPVDHSSAEYDDFEKVFFPCGGDAAADAATAEARLSSTEFAALRGRLSIRVTGAGAESPELAPLTDFEQLSGLGAAWEHLRAVMLKDAILEPTPIQAQTLPAVLCGRDVIGLSKTGSGKTLAYIVPMCVHVMAQPELRKGEGPIAVVLVPTRELAQAIHSELRKYSHGLGLQCALLTGGVGKYEQFQELRALAEIVVATPGRLIDLLKMRGTNLRRCTFLVLDEVDRLLDLGFEPQIRSIVGQIRPDRQTLVFSATMRRREERLVRDVLTDPLRIAVGTVGEANQDVRQVVEVLDNDDKKLPWLLARIAELAQSGSVLIFVSQRARAEEVCSRLLSAGCKTAALHGEVVQSERQRIMFAFKNQNIRVLVATDLAARGLDIPAVKAVISLDSPRSIDAHVHRIGRTGRAGAQDGVAYSLVTRKEAKFAGELVHSLEQAGQHVSQELLSLASQNPRFRRFQQKSRRGGGGSFVLGRGRRWVPQQQQRGGGGAEIPPPAALFSKAPSAGQAERGTSLEEATARAKAWIAKNFPPTQQQQAL